MEYAQPTVNLSLGADTQGEENHLVRTPSDSLHHSVYTNSPPAMPALPACPTSGDGEGDGHNTHPRRYAQKTRWHIDA